jgi:hypothetical protein
LITPAKDLLQQPLHSVAELSAADIPVEPGVYAWYRRGGLFYVGESRRGLRSRLWGNHLRGNARSSTLRNKVAKTFEFPPTGFRAYGRDAEETISGKLLECDLRFLPVPLALIDQAQANLIGELDPPMNDHPGQVPRWRIDEVREILGITPQRHTTPPIPGTKDKSLMSMALAESQRVTLTDIRAGRIRFPREAKRYFPTERDEVQVVLRGVPLGARYDPRTGPDKERSAVLLVGKANLEALVQADEVLSISLGDGIVRLD